MDIAVSRFFQGLESVFSDVFFGFFYYLGYPVVLLFACAFLYYCIDKRFAYRFVVTFAVSMFTGGLLKLVFNRPRPFTQENGINLRIETDPVKVAGNSMPSGHAMLVSAYALPVAHKYGRGKEGKRRLWVYIAVPLGVLFVGLSRIYMGAHYLTDILAGFALGLLIAFLIHIAFEKLGNRAYNWGLVLIPAFLIPMIFFHEASCSSAAGIAIPLLIGAWLDRRFVGLDVERSNILTRALRIVVASAGAGLMLLLGAKGIVEPWQQSAYGISNPEAVNGWSYFLLFLLPGIWIYLICPFIFKYAPLLFRKKRAKAEPVAA